MTTTSAATRPWKPKICENVPNISEETLRWAAQLGIDSLALSGRLADSDNLGYWTVESCRTVSDAVRAHGLEVGIMMFNLSPTVVWGAAGRDQAIDNMVRSINAAGEAGYPVVEYNFYNHRAVEGYGERPGRGGCLYTDYDDARMRPLEPTPQMPPITELTAEKTWDHFRHFLERVVPAAEAAGVRLACHPNDPPPPTSRGAAQVLSNLDGMQKLVDLVPSRANGITLCQGSFAEWEGMDVVAAVHYFGSRDKIHHVHYRNPRGTFPTYVETWIDEGDTDMLAAMQAYRAVDYRFTLCSDHVPKMTDDLSFGLIGRAYNHGYIKAMIHAANVTN